MNWDHIDQAVLTHWRALGSFRHRHVAIAHGWPAGLAARPYVFSRVDGEDGVVVALDVPAGAAIRVAPVFAEGEAVRDGYSGAAYAVHSGAVAVAAAARAVLLERVAAA